MVAPFAYSGPGSLVLVVEAQLVAVVVAAVVAGAEVEVLARLAAAGSVAVIGTEMVV